MIAESGQCFRWKKVNESPLSYEIIHKGHYLKISDLNAPSLADNTAGNGLRNFELSCDESTYKEIWAPYFDTATDYQEIEDAIISFNDPHLLECFAKGSGIRILRQDLWEMIVSFMISQNNNIRRISNSIDLICKKAAIASLENPAAYAFPLPGQVDDDFWDDSSLGLGYRVPYLKEIYKYGLNNPDWLASLEEMTFEEAYKDLLSHFGIGPKVSNCICLFGLHHTDAFPIDTHIKQLLQKYYDGHFDTDYFKGFAGIIQQYLFYFEIS